MIQYPIVAGTNIVTRALEACGGNQTILCLHGVGARADRWRQNLGGFAEAGYRAIAIDLPGHGLSSKETSLPYSVPFWSHVVFRVMDELAVDKAAICGTSLGGHVAAHMACAAPTRIDALVMVGTLGVIPMGSDARHGLAEVVEDQSREGILRKLKSVVYNQDLVSTEWAEEEYRVNNSPGANKAFNRIGAYCRDKIDHDIVGDRLNSGPTRIRRLLVWGAQDAVVPISAGVASQSLLGDTQLVSMRNCGHAPYYERPGTFNEIVQDFLSDRLASDQTLEM